MLIFLSKFWWQKSDILSQASYMYPILWETFFDPSDSYFLFADLVGIWLFFNGNRISRRFSGRRDCVRFLMLYLIWKNTYTFFFYLKRCNKMNCELMLTYDTPAYMFNVYPISWEAFLDPSDSYFLFANCWFLYTLNIYIVIFRRIFLSK
jgi:hypothetical protein